MSSAYQVIFKREALKYLSKQDAFIQKRIYHGIKGLLESHQKEISKK